MMSTTFSHFGYEIRQAYDAMNSSANFSFGIQTVEVIAAYQCRTNHDFQVLPCSRLLIERKAKTAFMTMMRRQGNNGDKSHRSTPVSHDYFFPLYLRQW